MHRKKEGLTLWEKVKIFSSSNTSLQSLPLYILPRNHLTSQSSHLYLVIGVDQQLFSANLVWSLEFCFCELFIPKLSKNTWRHVVRTSPVPPPHKKKLRVVHIIPHLNGNLTQMMVSSMTRTEISMHQCFLHYSAPVGRILLPQQ